MGASAMGKCADCGFLALRRNSDHVLIEAEVRVRENGFIGQQDRYDPTPVCFAQAYHLHEEMKGAQGKATLLAVVGRERECNEFTPWVQGYSPKDHRDMLNQQVFLNWQKEQRREDQKWRAKKRGGKDGARGYLGRSLDVEDEIFEQKIEWRRRNGKEVSYTRTVTRETFLDAEIERILSLKASGYKPVTRQGGRGGHWVRNTPPDWPDDPKAEKQNGKPPTASTAQHAHEAKRKGRRGRPPKDRDPKVIARYRRIYADWINTPEVDRSKRALSREHGIDFTTVQAAIDYCEAHPS